MPSTKLHGLDHLRALAITLVFFYHYSGIFAHPEGMRSFISFGWTGVDLFFVLSGYLIASHLLQEADSTGTVAIRRFYTRRAFRILPVYALVLTLYCCFPWLRERSAPAPLWKYLTFTQNINLDIATQGAFSHCWSLCIEEQFYLLLPLCLLALLARGWLKQGVWLLPAACIGGIALRWWLYNTKVATAPDDGYVLAWCRWIYYPTFSRLDGLLAGISIAVLFQYAGGVRSWLWAKGNVLLVAGGVVLLGAWYIASPQETFMASVFGFPLVAAGYGLVVCGAISGRCFLYRYRSGITAGVARLSYSIYLCHKIVIHVVQELAGGPMIATDGLLMMLLCIMATLLAALALNRLIEQPLINVGRRWPAGTIANVLLE